MVQRFEIMRLTPLLFALAGPGADAATHYVDLKSFGIPDQVGDNSLAELIQSGDGALYGTTHNGGPDDSGTVFKINSDGSGYRTLHVFHGAANPAFAGASGRNYELMRSTDLTNWTSLGTIVMPPSASYNTFDNTPPVPAVFYRALWVP